ncbi:MAG: hypothetical protein WDN49_26410 [Acetobacteraceae bacterium]
MLLDPSTLLVTMILVILLTSSSYVVVWLQDRQQVALLWMTASALLGAASFAVRVLFPTVSAIMISNPGVLAAIGCIWMACRAIRGRKVLPWALLIPGAVWIALCAVPGFLEQSGVRSPPPTSWPHRSSAWPFANYGGSREAGSSPGGGLSASWPPKA